VIWLTSAWTYAATGKTLQATSLQSVETQLDASCCAGQGYNSTMSLIEQIQKDIVTAMKAREEQRLSTLRMVKTALKNREIEKMAPLDDKESAEIVLIETYLPKAAGEEQIIAGVKAVIAEMGSPTMKDMGAVMKNVMARFSGAGVRVDGKAVSEVVKKELAGK
jgi:uncharacterized protein